MNKKIGDKIKYQEWHYGTIVAIKDGMAEIETAAGIKILKPLSKIVTDKQLPKYIDLNFGKYRFRYKGEVIGTYATIEEAEKAKEEYLSGRQ